jgi:hypothetical protein
LGSLGFLAKELASNNSKKSRARNNVQQIAAAIRTSDLGCSRQPEA